MNEQEVNLFRHALAVLVMEIRERNETPNTETLLAYMDRHHHPELGPVERSGIFAFLLFTRPGSPAQEEP